MVWHLFSQQNFIGLGFSKEDNTKCCCWGRDFPFQISGLFRFVAESDDPNWHHVAANETMIESMNSRNQKFSSEDESI
jgi:hypothetical protein